MADEIRSRVCVFRGQTDGGASDHLTETYEEIENVGDVEGPGAEKEDIEVTNQKSTAKEYISGISDAGTISFPVNYIPSNTVHRAMRDEAFDSVRRWWRLDLTTQVGATVTVVEQVYVFGELTTFGRGSAVNAAVSQAATIKVSGKPIFVNP